MKRQLSSTFNDSGELEESPDQSFILLAVTSSAAKQQATKQPSLQKTSQSTARKFHLDWFTLGVKPVGNMKKQIEEFLKRHDNSVVNPDVRKAKKDIRYHLSMLQELHKRFIVDQSVECSYFYFTKHMPEYIIKPKPEDWGTCLCMPCLNPELKLEAIKKKSRDNYNIHEICKISKPPPSFQAIPSYILFFCESPLPPWKPHNIKIFCP